MIRIPCFVCGEVMDAHAHPAATPFYGHPGYGSTMDGSTAGNQPMEIWVCDGCLEGAADRVRLRKTTTTTTHDWRPWLCQDCLRPVGHGQCDTCTHPPTHECPDEECMLCGLRDCPLDEPLHYHHDGCPACSKEPPIP